MKRNIRAFGGDPNRIAIAGQSAGAMSVAALLASPLTAGLYSAAVLQSGGPRPGARTKAEAEAHGLEIQKKLGCASIEEMRAKPVEDILAATCLLYTSRIPASSSGRWASPR